ncbi:hypothetical protein [Hyphomicrobium sp.]|uniref:hypothetical protein n=1 Tax=Hyphomicrobium sp. TaxID=82 RepID=UPI0025BB17A7|nr:hypothetical protein [Hyphomicrobium sp.]MCC7253707.1 hypothetical protein [Hyphomicrobium sp.]
MGKFSVGIAVIAIVAGATAWLLFGWDIATRYLYLWTGIGVAIVTLFAMAKRLRQRTGTIHDQILGEMTLQGATSQPSKILRLLLSIAKEAIVRITYWPLEIGLMAAEDHIQRAPNLAAKTAVGYRFSPYLPLVTAAAMFFINIILLILYSVFQFPPGGAFEATITVCIVATIIWFADLLVNPIERQLRTTGTASDAATRFVFVFGLAVLAVIVLIYTYRLLTTTNTSLAVVVGDVLFGGHFNPDVKRTVFSVYEALAAGNL